MIIEYFAQDRGYLVPGHQAGSYQKIVAYLQNYDSVFSAEKTESRSIAGRTINIIERLDETVSVTTQPIIYPADNRKWLEFLSSTVGGEFFWFDEKALVGSVDRQQVQMTGTYSKTRISATKDYFQYSWQMRRAYAG